MKNIKYPQQALALLGCFSFISGVIAVRLGPIVAWVFCCLVFIFSWRHSWRWLLLSLVFISLGWWRGSTYQSQLAINQSVFGKKVSIIGIAQSDSVYAQQGQLMFDISDVRTTDGIKITGDITVKGFGELMIYRGDTVSVSGKLQSRRGNSVGAISYAQIKIIQSGQSFVANFSRNFAASLRTALPEPVATFAVGLLVGQQSDLPQDVQTQLRQVGLTHIIAVSGYNLTVLAMAARRLLEKQSKYQTLLASFGLIGFFIAITGTSPPIVRASIISGLSLWAWYYGRAVQPLVLLLASAAFSVALTPSYIWGNVSWFLSFLAFYGVLIIGPQIVKLFYKGREPPMLSGLIIETLCATIAVLPYSLYVFGQMSLVGIFANIMVVPLTPLAMLLCAVSGFTGLVIPVVQGWIAWPAHLLLLYMLDIARWWSQRPQSFLDGIGLSLSGLAFLYACQLAVVYFIHHANRRQVSTGCPKAAIVTPINCQNSSGDIDMSGHSKWSTIKRQKAVTDAKRGAVFTRIGNQIAIAARGGSDPTTNTALAMAIDKARAANMPMANIERAIQRVTDKNAAVLQELLYEGYGPGGVAIIVEAATDNINRTYPEVRLAFSKHGGNIAEKGAVAFQFARKGTLRVAGGGDDLMLQALDAGAEDVQDEDGEMVIYTDPKELAKVRDTLQLQGIKIQEAELTYVPNTTIEVTDKDTAGKIMRLMDALDDCDDVTATHVNFDIDESLL